VGELWIDPGIGFAKTPRHNLALLNGLDRLVAMGWPVAVGTSRKSFLGGLTPGPDGRPARVDDRLEASVATAAWSVLQGASLVRVHDVAPTVMAVRLASPATSELSGAEPATAAPTGAEPATVGPAGGAPVVAAPAGADQSRER
jgi:dihydropteroate synthase